MRKVVVALTLMTLLGAAGSALANNETSLVMHAVETTFGICEIPDPCPDAVVNIPAGASIAAYLVVRNYVSLAGVQTAFDWGSWVFTYGLWDCQVNQVNGVSPTAPGPTSGTIATAFDAVTGGASAVIGRMHLMAVSPGCIEQVMSSYPFGNHVVDDQGVATEILDETCWGKICVDTGGLDTCAPCQGSTPVESSTWGSIKAQYN